MAKPASFLLWSDFHAHNWKLCSKIVDDPKYGPINDRLLDSIGVIRQLGHYATRHGIDTICFAGDLFHVPETTPTDVISIVFQELKELSKIAKLWMIPGNHDMALKSGLHHALVPLSEIAEVCTKPELLNLGGHRIHFVPYREDKEEYLKQLSEVSYHISIYNKVQESIKSGNCNILISHIGVQGAKVGSDYVLISDGDIEYAQLKPELYDAVFLGHFHEPQQLGPNAWYIGATHQHNWGDAGGVRGFLHVKIHGKNDITFDRIETHAPRFVTLDDETTRYREGDFVRVLHKAGQPMPKIKANKARYFDIKTVRERKELGHISLPSTMVQAEVLKAWVEGRGTAFENKDKLLSLGLEILKEANDE